MMPNNPANKDIKLARGKASPNYFDTEKNDWDYLRGAHGGNRVLLWGTDGRPLLTEENPGKVEVTNTVNAQLTGSLAPIDKLIDLSITSGSLFDKGIHGISDYSKLRVTGRTDKPHSWKVGCYYSEREYSISTYVSILFTFFESNSDLGQGELEAYTDGIRLRINNYSEEDRRYDIYLYGVR